MPVRYRRLRFELEGDGGQLVAALWEAGTLGVEQGEGGLTAYFEEPSTGLELEWGVYGGRLVESEPLEDRDWLEDYRAQARPIEIGRRLLVDPREPELAGSAAGPASSRDLLRLPARRAFGTGSHESTRLVLEWLERSDLAGKRVLDVGFGSGILSFTALLWGAAQVVGVEIDLESALVASQNRELNALFPSWTAGGLSALGSSGAFDLALVNVLPERVAADLPRIRCQVKPGGTAVFSGIVRDRAQDVCGELELQGFRSIGESAAGEWLAIETRVLPS